MLRTKMGWAGTALAAGVVATGVWLSPGRAQATPVIATTFDGPLPPGVHQRADGRYLVDACDHSKRRHCFAKYLLPEDWKPGEGFRWEPKEGPLASGMMQPSDYQVAYNLPDASVAGGKIVALIDAPDNTAYNAVSKYRSTYGLPTLPKCSGLPTGTTPCFAQVNQDGGPSPGYDNDAGDDGETELDMAMISAACPDCSILLVETNMQGCTTDMLQGVQTAAKLGAVAISISFGGPESTDPAFTGIDAGSSGSDPCPAEDSWTNDPGGFTTPGHVVFAAAGDYGYDNEAFCQANSGACSPWPDSTIPKSPSYPSSATDIIAVGGTTVTKSGTTYTQVVWNQGSVAQDVTTSGCSSEFPALPWQASYLSGTGCTGRVTADISAAADFGSGGIASCSATSCGGMVGSSASSPAVAAMFARLGLTEITSNYIDWPYSNASAFNDVTSGTDDVSKQCTTADKILCSAGTGWDGPSGVGTPNGAKLVAALAAGTTPPYPTPAPYSPTALADAGTTTPSLDAGTVDSSVGPTKDASVGPAMDSSVPVADAYVPPSNDSGTWNPPPAPDASTTPPADAATSNWTPDSGTPGPTPAPKSSSGCDIGGASGNSSGFGASGLLLGLAALFARRRRAT